MRPAQLQDVLCRKGDVQAMQSKDREALPSSPVKMNGHDRTWVKSILVVAELAHERISDLEQKVRDLEKRVGELESQHRTEVPE